MFVLVAKKERRLRVTTEARKGGRMVCSACVSALFLGVARTCAARTKGVVVRCGRERGVNDLLAAATWPLEGSPTYATLSRPTLIARAFLFRIARGVAMTVRGSVHEPIPARLSRLHPKHERVLQDGWRDMPIGVF